MFFSFSEVEFPIFNEHLGRCVCLSCGFGPPQKIVADSEKWSQASRFWDARANDIYRSIYQSICMSLCLSVCLSVCLCSAQNPSEGILISWLMKQSRNIPGDCISSLIHSIHNHGELKWRPNPIDPATDITTTFFFRCSFEKIVPETSKHHPKLRFGIFGTPKIYLKKHHSPQEVFAWM